MTHTEGPSRIVLCTEWQGTRGPAQILPSAGIPWPGRFLGYLQDKCARLNAGKPADFPRYYVGDLEYRELYPTDDMLDPPRVAAVAVAGPSHQHARGPR